MATDFMRGNKKTVFTVTIKKRDGTIVDVSSASTKQIILRKPNGEKVTWSAEFFTDGSDGVLMYTDTTGELDQSGIHKLQAYLVLPSWEGKSSITAFDVKEPL